MAVKKGGGSGEKTGEHHPKASDKKAIDKNTKSKNTKNKNTADNKATGKKGTDKKASAPRPVTARVIPAENAFARKAASRATPEAPEFQSDLALDIMEELYPLLLENCTDEDDEIDTQAVFEVLAGLIGLFTAEYHENYGAQKASAAFQDLVSLALATYQQRLADSEA
ncbi:hypothetical protein [Vampirovibrio chlorellavorus]|uniref:hypothetical protein n=1 Tax=Vampirovibrio chlorellavorus TaxID=758823 RepID=UPI0026F09E48|nr:hypothetical protein [Vampirovibrio chlorellavorus]